MSDERVIRSYAKDDLVRVPHGEYDEWPGRVERVTPERVWVRRFNIRNGRTLGLNRTAEPFFPQDVKHA